MCENFTKHQPTTDNSYNPFGEMFTFAMINYLNPYGFAKTPNKIPGKYANNR